jgi:hypothetical protein
MIALRLPMFAAFFLLLLSAPAFGVDVGGDFVDRVERAVEEGTIDREEALLNVFHYVFDPGRVRTDLAADGALPVKCLTPMIEQFHEQRGSFRPSTVESIEEYLRGASPAKAAASTYDSPGGRFRLTYET